MAFIGLITGLAMFALGMPSALALGVLAAVLEFVPFLGAVSAALPAAIIALASENPYTFAWVLLAYLTIQQLEGNVLSPLIQQWAVRLPPALGLFALLVGGTLFGPLGVLLATPATVVIIAFVEEFHAGRPEARVSEAASAVHGET